MCGAEAVDEQHFIDSMDEQQWVAFAESSDDDSKIGWQMRCSDSGRQQFAPGNQRIGCLLPDTIETPLDYFLQLVTPDTIDHFCERTNAYARAKEMKQRSDNQENEDPNATDSDSELEWEDVTSAEMRAFIGCVMCMGVVVIKDTKRYWSEDIGPALIRRTFSRDRFKKLLANWHISDPPPDDQPPADRLHKVRQLNDRVADRFILAFYPSQWVAVDEAMVGFKGRSAMKQYVQGKSKENGFKVWMLVDSETNYVYRFDVYTGRKVDGPEVGLAHRVVLRLIAELRERAWHAVAMDGFFSSTQLFKQLYHRGFLAVATTRNWVTDFPQAPLCSNGRIGQGQFVARQQSLGRHSALTCVSWMDRKPVNLLTTTASPLELSTCRRWRKSTRRGKKGHFKLLSCPQVLSTYMTYMRGVDVYSQRESYTRIGRKTPRWWPHLAWFMIDMAANNAYVLYRLRGADHRLTAAQFREQLMVALVGSFTQRKKRGRPEKVRYRAEEPHIPMRLEKEQVCSVCAEGRKRKQGQHKPRTREGCQTCGCAVHFACWKKHLNVEEEETE